jgi:putative transposase
LTNRDLPALRSFSIRPSFDQIEKAVDSALRSDEKVARQVKLYLCHRYSGRKLREIGSQYDMGLSGVTQASHRICLKAEKDKKLSKLLKRKKKNIFFVKCVGLTLCSLLTKYKAIGDVPRIYGLQNLD